MMIKVLQSSSGKFIRWVVAVMCVALRSPGEAMLASGESPASAPSRQQPVAAETSTIPRDQLDALVAPVALYPDSLMSQVLVASTYPLELIQLQQWLQKNGILKDKALVDAVSKQPWDPSIQAMAALPDVVKRLADDIQWTTDLGNAFLAQQGDVMDAVQRMRQKAQGTGALKSNDEQKVESQVVQDKTVIVIEQANPQVVYVPSYDPWYVYGESAYPYPAIYYPSYPPGAVAAGAISFGVGLAIGAAWGGGGWGWGCGWGNNDININRNNTFNRNTNISGGNRTNISGNRGGGNQWQHNPQHRGGAPYGDRNTANRFGGTARGDSLANRQSGARQQLGRQGGNLSSNTPSSGGLGNRSNSAGLGDRSRSQGLNDSSRSQGPSDRSRSQGGSDRGIGSSSLSGSGGDRIGSRDVGSGGGKKSSAFGGGSDGFSGKSARSSSSRGSSSFGRSSGGGFSGGGGGGFSRGGGGGSRGGGRRR